MKNIFITFSIIEWILFCISCHLTIYAYTRIINVGWQKKNEDEEMILKYWGYSNVIVKLMTTNSFCDYYYYYSFYSLMWCDFSRLTTAYIRYHAIHFPKQDFKSEKNYICFWTKFVSLWRRRVRRALKNFAWLSVSNNVWIKKKLVLHETMATALN